MLETTLLLALGDGVIIAIVLAVGFLLLIFAFVPGVLMDAGRLATRDLRDDLVRAPATEFATADSPRDLVARTIPDPPRRDPLDLPGVNEPS